MTTPTKPNPSSGDTPTEAEPTAGGARSVRPWHDLEHHGNGSGYLTGKPCIDCDRPAGTYWSHLWCQPCNAKRMDRIDASLRKLAGEPHTMSQDKPSPTPKATPGETWLLRIPRSTAVAPSPTIETDGKCIKRDFDEIANAWVYRFHLRNGEMRSGVREASLLKQLDPPEAETSTIDADALVPKHPLPWVCGQCPDPHTGEMQGYLEDANGEPIDFDDPVVCSAVAFAMNSAVTR